MQKYTHILFGFLVASLIFVVGTPAAHAAVTETFRTSTGKNATMNEFYRAEGNVGVVSKGVGLSNPRSGNIVINSVPAGVTIKQAWLYWGGYLTNVTETQLGSVNFNGTAITPSSSPTSVEFGRESNRRAFRADVSTLINAGGNGTYPLSVTSHTRNSTFGATLIIVYDDANSLEGTLVIMDGMVMISKSHAGNIANGESFTSTIAGLDLSDPPNGQATIIVSEGTAVDENEFTFNGSTSHNYGDFASNNDGLVWDSRTVDVAPYLDANTTSVSSTLADVDQPGWYSHYYLFMFYTNRMRANFAESTMTLGNGTQVRAGETVTATAVLNNTGVEQGDATLTTIFGGDTNTTYVPNSTEIDGVAKTDADDADEVTYDSGTQTLTIDVENIDPNATIEVSLEVTADNNLNTGDQINIQSTITTGGASFQTDSDGDEDDGIDEPARNSIVNGYRIKNLRNGLKTRIKSGESISSDDPTLQYNTTEKTIRLTTSEQDEPIADFIVPFTKDENAVNVVADANGSATVVHSLDNITQQAFTLFIAIPEAYQQLPLSEIKARICVGANSMEQIEPGCVTKYENVTNEYLFTDGDTLGGMTCTIEQEESVPVRWKCTGVTGTGGQSEGPPADVPEFHWIALSILLGACMFWAHKELATLNLRNVK